jgi:hypothetical protein
MRCSWASDDTSIFARTRSPLKIKDQAKHPMKMLGPTSTI